MAVPLRDRVLGAVLTAHQFVYDRSGGRIGATLAGRPMLLLRTVGAKTGKARTAALLYVGDGDDYAVIASKGGDDRHPGWYHNLMAEPDVEIQVGTETIAVHASVAVGDDRERLWAAANKINGDQYDTYQSRTTRTIPVISLSPV